MLSALPFFHFYSKAEIILINKKNFLIHMRITRDAIDELDNQRLRKAVRNAESDDRKTIRAEDIA
jgi:histone H3/H4